jgi:hypothetical protein
MKKVFLLTSFFPVLLYSQISEDFESGVLNNWVQSIENRWSVDTTACISGVYSLHHSFDNLSAGSDQAGISLLNFKPVEGTARWSFKIRYGCEPSASNSWSIFLMSDKAPADMMQDDVYGFVLGVNVEGYDDTLRLWKVKKGERKVIINSAVNWQNDIGTGRVALIEAVRSAEGEWSISVNIEGEGNPVLSSGYENELFGVYWFGICYKYTSTRDRLLWIDDIIIDGVFVNDTLPPVIVGCKSQGRNYAELLFNENVDDSVTHPGNFLLNDSIHAHSIYGLGGHSYLIEFEGSFINKSPNVLLIKSLCDRSGNCSGRIVIPFTAAWAETGDVIISEIMADPVPVVSLPGKEYIEILNRSDYDLELIGWTLTGNDQSVAIPYLELASGEIVILCSDENVSLFNGYGKTLGLEKSPELSDGGKMLVLSDNTGRMIHGVEYSNLWYGDKLKEIGGWSIEMIDTDFPFSGESGWKASVCAAGGTPGRTNSVAAVNPDRAFEGILNIFPVDSLNMAIRFSEPVHDLSGDLSGQNFEGVSIKSAVKTDRLQREFILTADNPLRRGKVYTIRLNDKVTDLAGNKPGKSIYAFGLPEPAGKHDIMFNELLFDPFPGSEDYIELYNCSDNIIDAAGLFLVSVSLTTGDTSGMHKVTADHRCILPHSYFTITADKGSLGERYFFSDPDNIFESATLPSMPDYSGHLILFNIWLEKIDEVFYDEKMHFPLLSTSEGVALEKIRPDFDSTDRTRWHSASESSGWGTPGSPNSVINETLPPENRLILSASRISPDNDGFEDVLVIGLNPEGPGNVVTVLIYDESGRLVRKLVTNMFAGEKASVVWNGTLDDGSLAPRGIYVILITMFDDKGKTEKWKKVCSVLR